MEATPAKRGKGTTGVVDECPHFNVEIQASKRSRGTGERRDYTRHRMPRGESRKLGTTKGMENQGGFGARKSKAATEAAVMDVDEAQC